MKRTTRVLVLVLLCMATVAQAKTLSRVAAVVNDEVISTYQLEQEVNKALSKRNDINQLSTSQFDQLRVSTLDKLINDKLIEQRSRELNLNVSDTDVSSAIQDVQAKNGLTRDQLIQALTAQGMTMDSYRQQVKKEILRYKLLSREVNYKVLVTSGEVRDYFREHIDEYRVEPKVRVSRISFPVPVAASQEQLADLESQVGDVRRQLQEGAAFDQVLAAQANANGGDMGEMAEKDLAEPLQKAIHGLEEGDISEPMQLNGQIHLFLVTFRNPGDSTLFDRIKGEIEDKLRQQKTDARFKEWQAEIHDSAFIEKRI